MRILLVGEFSRLHNSLKAGLVAQGHDVILVNNGDGFKNYPTDVSIKATFFKSKLGSIPRQIWFRLFGFDLALLEHGLRFWWHLPKLEDFDVVQLINEKPIQTCPRLELYLLKKLFRHNKNVFLLSCGVDYSNMQYQLQQKEHYSLLTPYFENKALVAKQYTFMFEYTTPKHQKIHDFLYSHCKGVIAGDLDYVNAIQNKPNYLGLIPYPVVLPEKPKALKATDKVVLFLGINSGNSFTKGVPLFEAALACLKEKYGDQISILHTTDVPYALYQKNYEQAQIILDQVYAFDQGYNALEAMAKGKVVFTGAEAIFLEYYNLQPNEVAVNALPNVDALVTELSFLIDNPQEMERISKNAIAFVKEVHDANKVVKLYVEKWKTAIS